jgi:hypothetical protein
MQSIAEIPCALAVTFSTFEIMHVVVKRERHSIRGVINATTLYTASPWFLNFTQIQLLSGTAQLI